MHVLAGTPDLREAFARHVDAVRAGADAESVARANYLQPNASKARCLTLARLLHIASRLPTLDDATDALIAGCCMTTARPLDGDDHVIPLEDDRRYAMQARFRDRVLLGARLLALRGASRCLLCETPMVRRRQSHGPIVARAVYDDYCSPCQQSDSCALAEWPHREAIRTVLDAAASARPPDSAAATAESASQAWDELLERVASEDAVAAAALLGHEARIASLEGRQQDPTSAGEHLHTS